MLTLNSVKYKKAAEGENTIMNKTKTLLAILLTFIISMAQVGAAFAAPVSQATTPVSGTIQSITLESDPTTGVVTVIVAVMNADLVSKKVRLSQETATALGFVTLDGDGHPVINEAALGKTVEIDPATVIPEQEKKQHPVANALATFFSDIQGLDYDEIMAAHEDGVGFGVIAQALWLTSELGGNSQLFQDLLYAKEHNDFSAFSDFTEAGTPPKNWGQLQKALLDKKNLGGVMSNHQNSGNQGSGTANNQDKNKDKNNNGHGNGNGNGNGDDPTK